MENVMLKKASVGRIVHFYSQTVADRNPREPGRGFNGIGAGPYPALVTQVFTDGDGNVTYANLKVFPPFTAPFDEGSVAERDSTYFQPGRYWEWPDLQANNPPAEVPTLALGGATVYELSFGASGVCDPETRRFTAVKSNDAVTRFAERVTAFDIHPYVTAGWVHLRQIDGEVVNHLLAWTKTSDECPTTDGEVVPNRA